MNMIEEYLVFGLCILMGVGVCGDSDEVKSVSVMEGHSVTLHTDFTLKDQQILWQFGHKSPDTLIAQIYQQIITIDDTDDKSFKDRLQLDSQTGSLTITNINITNSGLYKLQIISKKILGKTFNVTVYARLSVPVITSNCLHSSSSSERSSVSSCVLLCSVLNVSHVTLSWYNGSDLHSSISVSDLNIRLSLPLEVEYQDTNTYSCVLNNPITNHTTHLNITQLCQPCSDHSPSLLGVIIAVVLVILVFAAVFLAVTFYRKKSRQTTNEESRRRGTCNVLQHI